jgi:hypothetical protein
MSLFTEYEKRRELKSKIQIGSHWRWRGPEYRYNEIAVTRITPNTVYYHYTDTSELKSSTDIETFMHEAVYLGPVVEPAH